MSDNTILSIIDILDWARRLRSQINETLDQKIKEIETLEDLVKKIKQNNVKEIQIMKNDYIPKNTVIISYNFNK
jgi:hypothetical protein